MAHIEDGGLLVAMLLLFVSSMIEYIFPPFPGDTVVLFGAFLIGTGIFPLLPIFISICLGSLLGTLVVYSVGLRLGLSYFKKKKIKFIPPELLVSLQRWFQRWGAWPIVLNRFLPAYRSLIILAAGIGGLKIHKVLFFSTLSILVWNGLIILVGSFLGNNWKTMFYVFKAYSAIVVVLVSLLLMTFIVLKWRKGKKRSRKVLPGNSR